MIRVTVPITGTIIVQKDGDSWCATYPNFKNLQESDAGFGDTIDGAISDLLTASVNDEIDNLCNCDGCCDYNTPDCDDYVGIFDDYLDGIGSETDSMGAESGLGAPSFGPTVRIGGIGQVHDDKVNNMLNNAKVNNILIGLHNEYGLFKKTVAKYDKYFADKIVKVSGDRGNSVIGKFDSIHIGANGISVMLDFSLLGKGIIEITDVVDIQILNTPVDEYNDIVLGRLK